MSSGVQRTHLLNKLASSSQTQPESFLKYTVGAMK